MSQAPEPARAPRLRLVPLLLGTGLVLFVGAGAVVYGMRGTGKEAPAACAGTAATVARLDPLIRGEVAALSPSKPAQMLDQVSFDAGDGTRKTLADFHGKTVLLNLWATWCIPCRQEMPALDRLQAKLGGPDFQVVAVNIDTARLERPKQFLADVGATTLPFYADPTAKIFQDLRQSAGVLGLPTTFLLDRNGCTLGSLAGAAGWSSDEAQRLIEAAKS